MSSLNEVLRTYLRELGEHGSPFPKVVTGLSASTDWSTLKFPPEVTLFDDLRTYFTLINGYDANACHELDVFEPDLAWGMTVLSLQECLENHKLSSNPSEENPDYWPSGFLPLLSDHGGSYLVVNCRAASPTYGAVYDMGDGVGCCRVASSLAEFFEASTREVVLGLRVYKRDGSSTTVRSYLDDAASLYGESPFFVREGQDEQIVDWHSAAVPQTPQRRGRRTPPVEPPNENAIRWADAAGVPAPTDMGGYHIRLSTAPVGHWFFARSKLKPDTVNVEADIRHDRWMVRLSRHDGELSVDWSDAKQPHSYWPELDAIENFPLFVKKLESRLGIRFISYADVSFPENESRKILANPRLLAWLAPCASKVDSYLGSR